MRHHDAQQFAQLIVFAPLLLIMIGVAFFATENAEQRLADPTDASALPIAQLPARAALVGYGSFSVRITKQSGAPHSQHTVQGSAADAIGVALATFRRAGIGEVNVRSNTPDQLSFNRLFYGYGPRGQMKGQKVAAADIRRIA